MALFMALSIAPLSGPSEMATQSYLPNEVIERLTERNRIEVKDGRYEVKEKPLSPLKPSSPISCR